MLLGMKVNRISLIIMLCFYALLCASGVCFVCCCAVGAGLSPISHE